ncbi:hypothetical protein [Gynurincola endophyticus]|uniref:hypothetical protein n=1 Tax=Gynurincola endophyticus TaxID=2479004 RepID=UPI000F8E7926|nr:hypothetical protein [Gynurincola endophyticus]
MRKIFLLIAICFYVSLTACNRSENNSSETAPAYIRLSIAGKTWSSDGTTIIGNSFAEGKHNFTLAGSDQTFEGQTSRLSIIFSTTTEITTGTYVLNELDGSASITQVDGKTYLTGRANNFVIQITEVAGSGSSKKFKGTFSGQLTGPAPGDRVTITNGEFSSL